jgi:cephalosporin hydroxylase
VRPQFVIESWTGDGGTALYWAHTLHGLDEPGAKVLTVAPKPFTGPAAKHWLWNRYVEVLEGDPTAPETLARISGRVKGANTLVVLDGEQDAAGVIRELRAYAPLVSRGSYLVVANTGIDSGGSGPSEAVRRFLSEDAGKDYEVDSTRDLLVLTSSPGGWLRRK